ncbi:hypothetical protein WOC76_10975 [Methylocystis sp. IM3]|uniref:hypothetical protein n=1 Tax=unclassified Methylocystis TaxID=2625913 RepID=UPI0030F9CEFD
MNRAEVAERRALAAERLAAEAAGDDAFAEELIRTNLAVSKQLDALRAELAAMKGR